MTVRQAIPAALIIAALTAWSVMDQGEGKTLEQARSRALGRALHEVSFSIDRYLSELEKIRQDHYQRTSKRVRARLQQAGVAAADIDGALDGDSEYKEVKRFMASSNAISKAARLWSQDMAVLGRKVNAAEDDAEISHLWSQNLVVWNFFAPRAPGFIEESEAEFAAIGLKAPQSGPSVVEAIEVVRKLAPSVTTGPTEGN